MTEQLVLFDGDDWDWRPTAAQRARLRRIGQYARYLRSPEWRQRRAATLASHPRCALCPSRRNLEVHHVYYDHLGHEPDEDLVVLCARCHSRHHGTRRPRDNRP
ncbi:MAG TPA: HNH endonuclease signature motif containing protein [Acidimicrobiales bacterium]|nr:HNH endonuclease signature motif containing protein [Acidimicrobiales bacterium]